jgi:hypothetical protein
VRVQGELWAVCISYLPGARASPTINVPSAKLVACEPAAGSLVAGALVVAACVGGEVDEGVLEASVEPSLQAANPNARVAPRTPATNTLREFKNETYRTQMSRAY